MGASRPESSRPSVHLVKWAALQWAEEVTRVSETHASDEAFAAVSAEFQPKEVSDLTIAIGLINLFNRLAIGLRRPAGS
jgi:alkylhydroperoxidase family enzyme